ncbi:hypothetical protein V5S91_01390 [Corynebacterium sp. PCR7]
MTYHLAAAFLVISGAALHRLLPHHHPRRTTPTRAASSSRPPQTHKVLLHGAAIFRNQTRAAGPLSVVPCNFSA